MKHLAKPFLVSAALCAATLLPAHAEIDVISLKAAIEASVEADYPKLDALYKDIHAHHRSEERRVGKECSSPCRSRWSPYH